MSDRDITTTSGETFTYEETCQLAALIYKRFGSSLGHAAAHWRRLMQNDTSSAEFAQLLADHARAA